MVNIRTLQYQVQSPKPYTRAISMKPCDFPGSCPGVRVFGVYYTRGVDIWAEWGPGALLGPDTHSDTPNVYTPQGMYHNIFNVI